MFYNQGKIMIFSVRSTLGEGEKGTIPHKLCNWWKKGKWTITFLPICPLAILPSFRHRQNDFGFLFGRAITCQYYFYGMASASAVYHRRFVFADAIHKVGKFPDNSAWAFRVWNQFRPLGFTYQSPICLPCGHI
jgi:hypothetical protein